MVLAPGGGAAAPPTLAIVGRPNVGKSTLFNRLAGGRRALVDPTPGLTRDRAEARASLAGRTFIVTDTPGFERAGGGSLEARMFAHSREAIAGARLCLFVVDARAGLTALDRELAALLRRSDKPLVLVANKCEGRAAEAGLVEAASLGIEPMAAISAEHGEGLADLYAAVAELMPEQDDGQTQARSGPPPPRLAVIGRPNVGKSTLVNALVGAERMLAGPEAGLTRDAVETRFERGGRTFLLVDTAGLRRRARVRGHIEEMSAAASLRAIRRADIVLLTMDPERAFERRDAQLAECALEEGRGLVLAVTHGDRIADAAAFERAATERAQRLPPHARQAPMAIVSGVTGAGLDELVEAAACVHGNWSARVKTRDLNDWLGHMVRRRPPPAPGGKRIRPRYLSQIAARPPIFVLIASRAAAMPESYRRYLANGLREAFDLRGCPILLRVRGSANPYAPAS